MFAFTFYLFVLEQITCQKAVLNVIMMINGAVDSQEAILLLNGMLHKS